MDCQRINELLSEFLDGTLPPALTGNVQRHLQDCASCRAESKGLQETINLLGRFETRRLSADFDARLFRRLEAEQDARRSRTRSAAAISAVRQWLGNPFPSQRRAPLRLAAAAALITAGLLGWQLYPAEQPVGSVDRHYVAACLQAHAESQIPLTHAASTRGVVPDADLASEEID